jgi:peptidoglycan/xylan/chitin deacetylase (PgdA/CDA1 family)
MVATDNMKSQTQFFFILLVTAAVVAMLVNPYTAQLSTAAARSHNNIQKRMKISTGLSGSTNTDHSLSSSSPSPSPSTRFGISNSNSNNNTKVVIVNFDDSHESEYTYGKPILDKYGFKATLFEVCNWVEAGYHDKDVSTTWQNIGALQQDGMDVEPHTMNHPNLNNLSSQTDLNYEIGQSKQCLINHGFNPTIFAYPNGEGADNSTVVNTVAKYYNIARTDTKSALTFLHCDNGASGSSAINGNNEQQQQQQQQQIDCRTYFSNGTLTPSNRYSINSWAHKHIERDCIANSAVMGTCTVVRYEYNNDQMFHKFVAAVNSQNIYNKDGIVRAIPIIIYHTLVNYPDLSYSNRPIDTTVNLFDAEMRYLYDNGFKVITMADLGYDENTKSLYIKKYSS